MNIWIDKLADQWRVLCTAIMFMTRIPVGRFGSGEARHLTASIQYYPLIGVLVGSAAALVFALASIVLPMSVCVVLTVLAAVLITGGFHEDGLADVADSTGVWTAERKLEVMKDSRIGTYGSLALIIALMLSVVSLYEVASSAQGRAEMVLRMLAVLILAHVLGRWSSLLLLFFTPYAREASANKVFVEDMTMQHLLVGTLIVLVVTTVCFGVLAHSVWMALLATLCLSVLARQWFFARIQGVTGDCLGATNKIIEVSVCLCMASVFAT